MKKMEEKNYVEDKICPICNQSVDVSKYLNQVFKDDPHANYISHLVTHYRHHHITSWNKCWGHNGHRYRRGWFGEYEEEKIIVNERAKRQLIRQGAEIFKTVGITPDVFLRLQNTEEATLKLAYKKLA